MRAALRPIVVFLLLVAAFSSVPYSVILHAGHLRAGNGMMVQLLMWCPGLAALATCWLLKIDVATLGWKWRPARYQAWSYFIPILYALPVYVAVWIGIRSAFAFSDYAADFGKAYGLPNWPRATALLLAIPWYATVGVITGTARTLGEEIGWRGFLFPRLAEKAGFTWGCLITGCIWALWHYPALLFADYNSGTRPAFALTCFTLLAVSASFIWGWMRLKSGSVWTSAILHASHNVFIQSVFDGMTAPVGRTLYITTEFGAGLVLTMGAVALYFWTRRGEVATARS